MIKAMKKGFVYFLFIIIVINVVQNLNKKNIKDKTNDSISTKNK